MTSRTLTAVATAAMLACATGAKADPLYQLSFLPAGFAASAINDTGQIVGTAGGAAAILSGGTLTSLAGILPSSTGLGINNAGDVAGSIGPQFGGSAYSYRGGTLTNIGALLPVDYANSYATAINDHGTVGGTAIPPVGEGWRGFVYQGGSIQTIGTFGGDYSVLEALNNHDAATGYAALNGPALNQPTHAFYYRNGALQDLGTLGGTSSEGLDLNDTGDVVGWSDLTADAGIHPFVYRNGSLVDLGTLGGLTGEAHAINNGGAIVGNSYLTGNAALHAFLYRDGTLLDLNSLIDPAAGWQLTDAYDINDAGQILGTACQGGNCTAVLLSPVPEPARGALLLAGLAVLAAGKWRSATRSFGKETPMA
jgi:probable HAF family extracellular repeat protein